MARADRPGAGAVTGSRALAAQPLDDEWVLRTVRDRLDELLAGAPDDALDPNSTALPPAVNPPVRP